MLKHEGILSVMYDFLSFYVHLLVTVITCKICMSKFGILVACDIENILHLKKKLMRNDCCTNDIRV